MMNVNVKNTLTIFNHILIHCIHTRETHFFQSRNKNKQFMPNGSEISVAKANDYIQDFIDNYYTPGDVPVKSMIMDAQLLRDYLDDTDIENVKFVLGEKPLTPTGTTLTLIVAGYDSAGDYVLTSGGKILDNTSPCPSDCPTGDAGNDLII